jgi:hypothetical protein
LLTKSWNYYRIPNPLKPAGCGDKQGNMINKGRRKREGKPEEYKVASSFGIK